MTGAGFPHSDIFGSKRACRSPKLIAACCVLPRLMKPRHPSIAVTGLCKRYYSRRLFYPLTSYLNFQRTKVAGFSPQSSHPSKVVGPDGLEPSTPRLSSACSNQLSYEPLLLPGCPLFWWSRRDSNSRPSACKADALPTELRPLFCRSPNSKELLFKTYFVRLTETRTPHRLRGLRPSTIGPNFTWARLLRKEVIQPQVPLRLPCYDFVPITSLTLGRRLHCWLANALRAKPAFMT
jgi:hypothetical protein